MSRPALRPRPGHDASFALRYGISLDRRTCSSFSRRNYWVRLQVFLRWSAYFFIKAPLLLTAAKRPFIGSGRRTGHFHLTLSPARSIRFNMQFSIVLAFFLGFVAAAPRASELAVPEKVKIRGVSLLGTGCPPGSADVQVDATGSLFEATFSAYQVETGPNTFASDWRKNCKLTLNMEFSSGFQYVVCPEF